MRHAIAMTAYGRPDCLAQTLAALRVQDLRGFERLYVAQDPGHPDEAAVTRMIRQIAFMPSTAWVNRVAMNNRWNLPLVVDRAFNTGADIVTILEDDILLSPDALDLVRWWGLKTELHATTLALCLFNDSFTTERAGDVERYKHFCPWGWACTRQQWTSILKPNWNRNPRGWDFSVVEMCEHYGRETVRPVVSRSKHIGETGIHFHPSLHRQRFEGRQHWTGEAIRDFRMI